MSLSESSDFAGLPWDQQPSNLPPKHHETRQYWRSMYEDQLRRKRLLHDRYDRLARAAWGAIETLGASHVCEEGPNAGWRGEGEDLRYDDDLVCRADCPVCAAVLALREVLAR